MTVGTTVSVRGLVKRYGDVTAVNGIDFEVREGEVFGLLGPNGAGKTTTLECLEGIRKPDTGAMMVAGCNPQSAGHELRRRLGVQLQASSLPECIRVDEVMALVCAWHGIAPRFDLLIRFAIEDLSKKQYQTLSTGQKRRLHLALALANDPAVVILDEPTAGLDVQGRAQLHDTIRTMKSDGVTIILATHDMAEAESLCDRIAILIRGNIAVMGTPAEVTAASHMETRITIRTAYGSLLPGSNVGEARFIKASEHYGEWMSPDAASSVIELLQKVQMAADRVEDLRVERPSLEERFLELVEGGKQQ